MHSVIHQCFGINVRVLQILGLYPSENDTIWKKVQACILYVLSIFPIPSFGGLYLLLENEIDVERLFDNAFILAGMTGYITKLLPFIINGRKLKICVDSFESLLFATLDNEEKKIMDECIQICQRNSRVFFTVVLGATSAWATKPFFWKHYDLPIDIWLPFSFKPGSLLNGFIYLFLVAGTYYSAFTNAAIDPLIGGLAYLAAGQFKILKYNLQNLDQHNRKEMCSTSDVKTNSLYIAVAECIRRHNALLRFAEEYENFFSSVVISQFMSSIFVICLSCLQLIKLEPLSLNFLIMATCLGIFLVQVYFYCYYGTTLIEESSTLTNAICMGNWYEYDVSSRKALIILMERSKRPVVITAGKVLDLSLDTFTTILRRSYSLLTVLRNY